MSEDDAANATWSTASFENPTLMMVAGHYFRLDGDTGTCEGCGVVVTWPGAVIPGECPEPLGDWHIHIDADGSGELIAGAPQTPQTEGT